MLIVSASGVSVVALPENELVIEFQMPEFASSSSDSKSAFSLPAFFVTRNLMTCDLNELMITRVPSALWTVLVPSALENGQKTQC